MVSRLAQGGLLVVLATVLGCGGARSRPQKDLDEAQEAVRTALNAWKADLPIKNLEGKSSIRMVDPDWSSGAKLLNFEIKNAEGVEGKTMRCTVDLSLRDRKDKTVSRKVVYEVDTSDTVKSIGREEFR